MEVNKLIQTKWKKLKKEVIIKVFFFLISFILISCFSNKCQKDAIYKYITSYEFDKYVQGDFSQSSPYNIVLLGKDEEYYAIPINILYPIYRDNYRKNKFEFGSFICKVLDNSILLNIAPHLENNLEVSKLELNQEAKENIEKNGLFNLLDKYGISVENEEAYVMYPNEFDDTLIYEFYKLGYLHTWDDFTGRYIFVDGNVVLLLNR